MDMTNKKITKIVVGKDDELTDIVSSILDTNNERIVITFAEDSDLLISPINLKVLLETADEREKLVVMQIIKNPTGVRNAKLAGLMVVESPTLPTEEVWETEDINRAKRLSPPVDKHEKREVSSVDNKEEKNTDDEQVEEKSDFQKKIDEAIEKSRVKKKEVVDDDITFDEDIPVENFDDVIDNDTNDLSKKDLNTHGGEIDVEDGKIVANKRTTSSVFSKIRNGMSSLFGSIKLPSFLKGKKSVSIILGSIFLVIILVGVIYYYVKPFVKVRIYVTAKEVSIEKVFTGDKNIVAIDFVNLKIPVKTESVEKSRSTTVTATGIAYDGEKAKGSVVLVYTKSDCDGVDPAEFSAGQVLTYNGNSYTLDASASVECNGDWPTIGITAADIGEEYNLSSNKNFAISGDTKGISAVNKSEISGGSKKEFTVLSQSDVDAGVESLKSAVVTEAETELKDKSGTWKLIDDSISSNVTDTTSSASVGSEVKSADVNIKVVSTATYFLNEGFDSGVEDLLTQEAKDLNLFENDDNLEFALSGDITKTVTVEENDENGIKIKLVASSSIKPDVNKAVITDALKNMSWEEGNNYLKSLKFSDKETEVEFNPTNFPDWLKYFPSKQGGVLIEIKEVY